MLTHSVVIPLYNKGAYVIETLDSLLHQRKIPDEIIIVDDASTDQGLNLVKAYLHKQPNSFGVQIIELQQNRGPGYARNTGLEKASGDLISFLDADDLYHPHLLQRAAEIFEDENVDFLVLNIEFLPDKDIYPELNCLEKYLEKIQPDLYRILHPLKAVSHPEFIMGVGSNVITRRSLIKERYTEYAHLNEGIDFWYRVLKYTVAQRPGNVALLTGEYLQVKEVPGSLSRKQYKNYRELVVPPLVNRYKESNDVHDILITGIVAERWFIHALEGLQTGWQKMLFILCYLKFLPFYVNYLILKKRYQ